MALRRSRLSAGALLLVAVTVFAACGWPQSRYGPERTGFNPFETTLNPANVSGLRTRWSQEVHGIEASPTIAGGVLYARSANLYAFDASTGSARWSSHGIGAGSSTPVVAAGVVYVVGDKLYAFDAATGAVLWSRVVGPSGYDYAAPVVAKGVVYDSGDKLYALNAATGAQLWSAALTGSSSPAVANGVLYFGADKLYALNAATGEQLWSTAVGADSSSAVANGVVYVGGDRLYALNAATGATLWSVAWTGEGEPVVANGVVYLGRGDLSAFNATTGVQLWSAHSGYLYGPPTVANGVVYVGSDKPYAYDAVTGAQLWSASGSSDGDELVVANGVVYLSRDGSELSAYSLLIKAPQLSIAPAFPDDYAFADPFSTTRTFAITNLGPTPTSVIADSLSGPDAAHFRIVSDGCAGKSLVGGGRCTVTASFAPTLSGARTAFLTAKAAVGGTADALLAGTAQPFTVSPSWKDFGAVFAGSPSTAVFTATNLSVVPIGPIASSVIEGSGFTVTTDACAGKIIAAGTSCTIAVTFVPSTDDTESGTLITRAPGYQSEASLQGVGDSRLAVAPSATDFGTVRVGTTASTTFTVTNISPSAAGPITDSIEDFCLWACVAPEGMSLTSDTCAAHTLAANASCTVVVTFAPTRSGSQYGWLRTAAPLAGSSTAWLTGAGG